MLLQSLVYFELCIIQSFHFIEYTEILPANAIKNKTMQKKTIGLWKYLFPMYGVMDIFCTVEKLELQRKVTYYLLS